MATPEPKRTDPLPATLGELYDQLQQLAAVEATPIEPTPDELRNDARDRSEVNT